MEKSKGQQRVLQKVISGGQTGADQGGLEAAFNLKIPTVGYAPKFFKTETGSNLTLKTKFSLIEMQSGYVARTKKNVESSDGTIAFRLHDSNGTDKTIGYCQYKKWKKGKPVTTNKTQNCFRPVLVIPRLNKKDLDWEIQKFIEQNEIAVVNIAGHRQTTAGVKNFQEKVRKILERAFSFFVDSKLEK